MTINNMSIFHALILGVVEGITEFLPISSTFHLIFASRFLGIVQSDFIKLFEVFIQSGAILSVALLYIADVVKSKELTKKVIISFLPTAAVGLILYKFIKNVFFESQILQVGIFAAVGGIFFLSEWLIKGNRIKLKQSIGSLSYQEALIIGLAQSLAVVPGVSRAGAVIVAMMFLGFKRGEAAYYSFLLSVPTIFAAAGYDLYKMRAVAFNESIHWSMLVLGFITAFASSFFVVKWFIGYLQKNTLEIFGFYRIAVAIILILILFT